MSIGKEEAAERRPPLPAGGPYPFREHRSCADVDNGRQGLTPRAAELLAYLRERETTPSFAEMAKALGVGKAAIHKLIRHLVERGAITALRHPSGYIKPHSIRVATSRANLHSASTADLIVELERRGFSWRGGA